jgi:hypothetical protein
MNFTIATQDALFAALNVTAMTDLAPVMQHVPEGTEPPLVIVGDISFTPVGGKDGNFDRAEVDIVTMYRGPKRAGLFALQEVVQTLLDGVALTGDALFSNPRQIANQEEIMEDGITYVGTQRFELFVQPL